MSQRYFEARLMQNLPNLIQSTLRSTSSAQ